MVLILVDLAAFILTYPAVCLLAVSTSNISSTTVLTTSSAITLHTHTNTPPLSTLPSRLSSDSASSVSHHVTQLTVTASFSHNKNAVQSSSLVANSTSVKKRRPRMPGGSVELSSFGIVMVVIGGILITVMIVCLLFICCRGIERRPGGAHTPHHSNVKMKPWKTADVSTTNELTEDTIDRLETSNHPQSHQNSGLANTSPTLSPASNNNTLNTTTESFRTLQTNSLGDMGDFGRKLSLGRQAYEPKASVEENAAGHEPALEAKGEPVDLMIHYV